jgi:hypothetical protein
MIEYPVYNELKICRKAFVLQYPRICMKLLRKTKDTSGCVACRLRFETGMSEVLLEQTCDIWQHGPCARHEGVWGAKCITPFLITHQMWSVFTPWRLYARKEPPVPTE